VFKRCLRFGLLVTFAVLMLFSFYSKYQNEKQSEQITQLVHVNCPLKKQSCLINLGKDFKLEVSLSPKGFPAMEPLILQLKSSQIDFKQIKHFSAFFEGRDMEMGKHSLSLSKPLESGVLLAKGLIPLCPMDPNMVWRLNIQFEYQEKMTSLQFEISSATH